MGFAHQLARRPPGPGAVGVPSSSTPSSPRLVCCFSRSTPLAEAVEPVRPWAVLESDSSDEKRVRVGEMVEPELELPVNGGRRSWDLV